jgi:Na+/H+ antiporter NhaB
MAAAVLDTHRIVQRLRAAGATEQLAETVTDVLRETRDVDLSQLTTKTDLQLLEQRMTIKLGGMLVVGIGAVAALVGLF